MQNSQKLSTQPYKGTRDFYPEDMQIRDYIFETWRKSCLKFGYQEYDGPLLEDFEIYAAKTGEEIVNEQLFTLTDKSGRKLAIRPEMTPTLARMVSAQHKTLFFPIRWFSIPNLWRYEAPQRGRLREHFQLNVDIFGVDSVSADFELLSLAVDIMEGFGATKDMFEIKLNNRRFLDDVFSFLSIEDNKKVPLTKAIDKKSKITKEEFDSMLLNKVGLEQETITKLNDFLLKPQPLLEQLLSKGSKGAQEIYELLEMIRESKIRDFVNYDPSIVRGFDYYTGNVFEQFDLNPQNNRSMYGGGRYDNLVEIFIDNAISGIGFGMGDVTLQNFLQDWNLLPKFDSNIDYLVTVWPSETNSEFYRQSLNAAGYLRKNGHNVICWHDCNTKVDKQLKFADRKNIKSVIIIGKNEIDEGVISVKNLKTGTQEKTAITDL